MRKHLVSCLAVFACAMLALTSCQKDGPEDLAFFGPSAIGMSGGHHPSVYDNVFILYAGGYNNLGDNISDNIDSLLTSSYVPSKKDRRVLLVVDEINRTLDDGRTQVFESTTDPKLIRLSRSDGKIVRDTLKVFTGGIGFSSPTFREIMNYISVAFPASHYGMCVSSHATGWLPGGEFAGNYNSVVTRTIGNSKVWSEEQRRFLNYELELKDFAAAIPVKLDYLIMDQCLCGGVEVAYELRGKCDKVVFSQTEVMSRGFVYSNFLQKLFENEEPDLAGIAEDLYLAYVDLEENIWNEGATVSVVDCRQMDDLARVCKNIFEENRDKLESVDYKSVQQFCRNSNKAFCFDLRDFLVKSGVESLDEFDAALGKCVLFCRFTDRFLTINIKTDCGLSTYIPAAYKHKMDDYYRTLNWNMATGLVKE